MSAERIAITGVGVVSAIGVTPESTWSSVAAGRSGLRRLTLFDSPLCGGMPVGEVTADPALLSGLAAGSRTDHLAAYAARAAFTEAGLNDLPADQRRDAGIVLGSCTGGMLDSERFLAGLLCERRMDADLLRFHPCSSPTRSAADLLGLGGFQATVSTACASGATAIGVACDLLRSGEARIVLAGGADSLTRLTLNGFCSLLLVDRDGCHPFDAERGGMSLGEGAGVLVLETETSARRRGAAVQAWLAGWGSACDAFHATAPSPDGSGARRAMAAALDIADLEPRAVDYINAHGTGTTANDVAEARAIADLFADRLPPVSSTKRFFGHTLAAAGAIEAVVCVLALRHQAAPANLGLRNLDPDVPFQPVTHTTETPMRVALTNSLGFGGNCASLVIRRDPDTGRARPDKLTCYDPKNSGVKVSGTAAVPDTLTTETTREPAAVPDTLAADAAREPGAVAILGVGLVCPDGKIEPVELPKGAPCESFPAYKCPAKPGAGVLPAGEVRRLGRSQRLAVTAAHLALRDLVEPPEPKQDVAVIVGTGLGETGQTALFLENMIELNEALPRPARFVNSVHNSLASQIAIRFGYTGENQTFSHEFVSFELALWEAVQALRTRRARRVLLCGEDEVSPYAVAAGLEFGWWTDDGAAPAIMADTRWQGTLMGEGAAAFLLALDGERDGPTGARITAQCVRPRRDDLPEDRVRFIQDTLEAAGATLEDVDVILLGANGDCDRDSAYRRVVDMLTASGGAPSRVATFKGLCGEFCTATAVGLALAAETVRSGRLSEGISLLDAAPSAGKPVSSVLMYNLHPTGHHSVILVQR